MIKFEPEIQRLMNIFCDIETIPHGSGNCGRVADYCIDFARTHGFEFVRDSSDNVIIKKIAQHSEQTEPVIIQAHIDMVCEKKADCKIDFTHDGLSLVRDGKFLFADKTTLGGDDGIGVAMALCLLDSKEIPHPPLEILLTSDEEIGMLGMSLLDASPLKGKKLLNLDSEDEGIFLVSCAGGSRAEITLPVKREKKLLLPLYKLKISGLRGGHSGTEIDSGAQNASWLSGLIMRDIKNIADVRIVSFDGGTKDNAIVRECSCVFVLISENKLDKIIAFLKKKEQELKMSEHSAEITLFPVKQTGVFPLSEDSGIALTDLICSLENGVISRDENKNVDTSQNLGIVRSFDDRIELCSLLRSSVCEKLSRQKRILAETAELHGATVRFTGEYPAWEYKKESKLLLDCKQAFENVYNREPVITGIHAGVECGILCGKIPGLDCVSLGPNIENIHTTEERLDLESTARTWQLLIKILEFMS